MINHIKNVNAVEVDGNTATLTWEVPFVADVKMYEIEISNENDKDVKILTTQVLTSTFKVEDLHRGTTYKYRVRAVGENENKKGPWTEYHVFTTGMLNNYDWGRENEVITASFSWLDNTGYILSKYNRMQYNGRLLEKN